MERNVLYGASGPMPISTFEEIVARHQYRPDVRFVQFGWGLRRGAPTGTCTLVVGSMDDGNARNIPCPEIPEFSSVDEKTQRIAARGWRDLLKILMSDRVIRPDESLRQWLGNRDFDEAKGNLGCT